MASRGERSAHEHNRRPSKTTLSSSSWLALRCTRLRPKQLQFTGRSVITKRGTVTQRATEANAGARDLAGHTRHAAPCWGIVRPTRRTSDFGRRDSGLIVRAVDSVAKRAGCASPRWAIAVSCRPRNRVDAAVRGLRCAGRRVIDSKAFNDRPEAAGERTRNGENESCSAGGCPMLSPGTTGGCGRARSEPRSQCGPPFQTVTPCTKRQLETQAGHPLLHSPRAMSFALKRLSAALAAVRAA